MSESNSFLRIPFYTLQRYQNYKTPVCRIDTLSSLLEVIQKRGHRLASHETRFPPFTRDATGEKEGETGIPREKASEPCENQQQSQDDVDKCNCKSKQKSKQFLLPYM